MGYCLVAIFIFPFGDDFTYALKGQQDHLFEAVLNEREIWNGRYLSNFILIIHPLNWGGIEAYRLMAMVLFCIVFCGTYCCFKWLRLKSSLLITCVALCSVFASLPNTTEAFYWLCGAWTYTPAAILLFVLFVLLLKPIANPWLNFVFLGGVVFLGSGFNELFGVTALLFLIVKLLHQFSWGIVMLIGLQTLLFLYVLYAPGNEVRAGLFSNNHQVINSVYLTGLYTVRFIGEWLLNPILYLFCAFILQASKNCMKFQVLKRPFFAITFLIVPIIIACFAPIWSTGILGQHRTANFACFTFFLIGFLILISNSEKITIWKKLKLNILFPLLLLSMCLWKNNLFLITDIFSGNLQRYSHQLQARVKSLSSCTSIQCPVKVLKNPPNTFKVYDLKDNPEHWINKGYQLYYNSGKVVPIKD